MIESPNPEQPRTPETANTTAPLTEKIFTRREWMRWAIISGLGVLHIPEKPLHSTQKSPKQQNLTRTEQQRLVRDLFRQYPSLQGSQESLAAEKALMQRFAQKGIGAITKKELPNLTEKDTKLVAVAPEHPQYYLHDISVAALRPHTRWLLLQILNDFHQQFPRAKKVRITGLTRTVEGHQALRQTNGNAAGGISAHCFGTTFDISYIHWNAEQIQWFAQYCAEREKKGEMMVVVEQQQPCFHITDCRATDPTPPLPPIAAPRKISKSRSILQFFSDILFP